MKKKLLVPVIFNNCCPVVSFQEFNEVPFLKKFKFKRQDRVYPKEAPSQAPTQAKAKPLASASSAPTERLPEGAPSGEGRELKQRE